MAGLQIPIFSPVGFQIRQNKGPAEAEKSPSQAVILDAWPIPCGAALNALYGA